MGRKKFQHTNLFWPWCIRQTTNVLFITKIEHSVSISRRVGAVTEYFKQKGRGHRCSLDCTILIHSQQCTLHFFFCFINCLILIEGFLFLIRVKNLIKSNKRKAYGLEMSVRKIFEEKIKK